MKTYTKRSRIPQSGVCPHGRVRDSNNQCFLCASARAHTLKSLQAAADADTEFRKQQRLEEKMKEVSDEH